MGVSYIKINRLKRPVPSLEPAGSEIRVLCAAMVDPDGSGQRRQATVARVLKLCLTSSVSLGVGRNPVPRATFSHTAFVDKALVRTGRSSDPPPCRTGSVDDPSLDDRLRQRYFHLLG
jgi:hypothetical protein